MNLNDIFKVTLIEENTYRIFELGGNYLTLLIGNNKAMLIDTGLGYYPYLKKIIEEITSLPLIVINSHGHLDHTGGNYLFEEIYINQNELKTYKYYQNEKSLMIESQKKRFNILKKEYLWPKNFNEKEYISKNTKKFIFLKDLEIFDLGNRKIELISVPGHTTGQMVAFDHKTKILFSSDAISSTLWIYYDIGITFLDYWITLENLKKYPIKYILSAHQNTKFPKKLIDALQLVLKKRSIEKSKVFIHPRNKDKALIFKCSLESLENFKKFNSITNITLVYSPKLA